MSIDHRVSTSDVARELGVSEQTIRYQVRLGAIPVSGRTPGGHSRFFIHEVRQALGLGLDASLGPVIPAAGTGTDVTLDDDPGDLTASARRFMAGSAGYDESRFDRDELTRTDGRWLIERLTGQSA